MRVEIIAVGSIKDKAILDLINEYSKRLKKYVNLNIIEVKDLPDSIPELRAKDEEGRAILDKIKARSYVIALDERGSSLSSPEFSVVLNKGFELGESIITFIIGGSRGLSDSVRERADKIISFSKMTFPHLLFRVMLLEQIFRACKINRGETYHK